MMGLLKKKQEEVKRLEFADDSDDDMSDDSEDDVEEDIEVEDYERKPGRPPINKERKESVNEWIVKPISIQQENFVFNQKTGKAYTIVEAMVELLNRFNSIN